MPSNTLSASSSPAGASGALTQAQQRQRRQQAQALAHILKVIDVTDILIGGGMSAGWPHMQDAFFQQLNTDLIPVLRDKVKVQLTNMGDQAGMVGAAMLAMQKL